MDKVTQRTAANAEESASAAEELNAQAEKMKGYVTDLAAAIGGHHTREPQAPGGPNDGRRPQAGPLRRAVDAQPVRRQITTVRPVTPAEKKSKPAPKRPGPKQIIPLEDGGFKDF